MRLTQLERYPLLKGSCALSFTHYSSIKFIPYNLAQANEALHLIIPHHFGPTIQADCPSISEYSSMKHTRPSIYHQSCQKPPTFSSSLAVLHGDTSVSRQRASTFEASLLKDRRACSSCLMRSCFFRLLESGRVIETFSGFRSIEFSQPSLERAKQLPSDSKISDLVFTLFTLSEKELWTYGSLGMGVSARTTLSYPLRNIFCDYSVLQAVLRLMASFSWFISLAKTTRLFRQESPAPSICTYLRIPHFKPSSGGEGDSLSGCCSAFWGEMECRQRREGEKMPFSPCSSVWQRLLAGQLLFSKKSTLIDSIVRFFFFPRHFVLNYYIGPIKLYSVLFACFGEAE